MAKSDCIACLVDAGISYADAVDLRRISMTLHRWHELECGDSNDYASWTIARGRKVNGAFEYDDNGAPFEERHVHTENKARYTPIADRERGALKRLASIMKGYPGFASYVQGDPRGAVLYILPPATMNQLKLEHGPGESFTLDSCYDRGIAVHK